MDVQLCGTCAYAWCLLSKLCFSEQSDFTALCFPVREHFAGKPLSVRSLSSWVAILRCGAPCCIVGLQCLCDHDHLFLSFWNLPWLSQ